MQTLISAIRQAYTLRGIRHALQAAGLNADQSCNSMVFIGAPEFIAAAAVARSTVGA